jgi:cellobiose phosphorylase
MDALHEHLVRPADGLIQLLTPPFDTGTLNPGYIKGYVPGVRENGGQYTHGAIWATMAFADLGDHERAWQLFNIINPINHGRTRAEVEVYKIEPYVLAADVYGVAPHIGRGGWSWYTGSAGWMYRLIIESLLGINLETVAQTQQLRLKPCLPAGWPEYTLDYRYHSTTYRITITQATSPALASPATDRIIRLIDDGEVHELSLTV